MGRNVFDQVARDYERIHDRSLPPGVHSADFICQRAANVSRWIFTDTPAKSFAIWISDAARPYAQIPAGVKLIKAPGGKWPVEAVRFDPSVESINEAKSLTGDVPVCLVSDWKDLPGDVRFDLVISCHVFHHIPPAERAATAKTLRNWMNPPPGWSSGSTIHSTPSPACSSSCALSTKTPGC